MFYLASILWLGILGKLRKNIEIKQKNVHMDYTVFRLYQTFLNYHDRILVKCFILFKFWVSIGVNAWLYRL